MSENKAVAEEAEDEQQLEADGDDGKGEQGVYDSKNSQREGISNRIDERLRTIMDGAHPKPHPHGTVQIRDLTFSPGRVYKVKISEIFTRNSQLF